MPIIYCEIQPFVNEQNVYQLKDDGKMVLAGKTPLEYLKNVLPEICYKKEVYSVKLKCSVRPIALELAQDIRAEEMNTYSASQITVEVE